jgi:hypothetical protein
MNSEIISLALEQTFGFFALICTVISMQLKKKLPLMILQTASEAFIVAQYFVKGAITGSLLSIVAFIRDLILTKYDKKRAPFIILALVYTAMTVFTILSWAGPVSLIPYCGSLLYAFTLWYGKIKWIRLGNALGNTPYLFYTLITGNYVLFAMTLFEVASSFIGFARYDLFNKKSKKSSKSQKKSKKTRKK